MHSITTDNFHLSTLGNGITLTLFNRSARHEIFLQGDDAAQVLQEIADAAALGLDYDTILSSIFDQYEI